MGGEVRLPAVAGVFYPDDPVELETQLRRFLDVEQGAAGGPRRRIGVMAPHAGYVYSGGVAGQVYAATEVPRRVVVLCPNHTGRGVRRSLWARGAWQLPGGAVPVDEELADRLLSDEATGLRADHDAHLREHALEVQLPFLRARNADVTVTPIVLGPLALDECVALGERLAALCPEDALLVASSDMNHFLSDDETRVRDRLAIDPLLALDERALYHVVIDEDLSMCGYIPTTVMLAFARARGAARAELVGYATSAEASGDRSRVVGYAGVVVTA